MTEKISHLAELIRRAGATAHPNPSAAGRNRFTRIVDRMLLRVRRYAPPLHWLGAFFLGTGFFLYAWVVGRTSRLIAAGQAKWPDIPAGCVLAIWHDSAPSLLGTIVKLKPSSPLVILVATEPRGDVLAVFCRLLGLRVIRGDWEHGGWPAITRMAELVAGGAAAIITPDGGGPRRVARPGALVLAAAARVPLVVLGADCHPALTEPHKCDQPRNPVPFCGIAISMNRPVLL